MMTLWTCHPQPKPQPAKPKPGPTPYANARFAGTVDRPAATINATAIFIVWFIVPKANITFQFISNASPLVLEILEKLWMY